MKSRVFPEAKTTDMQNYIKPTKRDFNSDLYIFHAGTNDFQLHKENCKIADVVNVTESLKSDQNTVVISATVPRADNFKEKVAEVNKLLTLKCREKGLLLMLLDNINPKRHLNKS